MATSYFQVAHHFVSNVDTVITATNYTQNIWEPDRAFEQLRENISDGAMHSSDERCDPPMCHPDTRKVVQGDIFSWITHGDSDVEPKRILWLSGPAGCGKTAIAGSVAEACEERGFLAATFFFSSFAGPSSRRSKRFFITTLAYQLLQSDGTGVLREHIVSAVKRDPTVFRKRLKDQCRILLLEPLQRSAFASPHPQPSPPQVTIIDSLDEVESSQANEVDHIEILSVLLQLVASPVFPFRVIIASRPERWIRGFFAMLAAKDVTLEVFLGDKYNPDGDITSFLMSRFSDIRCRYNIAAPWPTEGALKDLVHRASGQFIYAATAIRFVQDGTFPPTLQLDRVLRLSPNATTNPLEELDALYIHILNSSPDPGLASEWVWLLGGGHYPSLPARYCRQLFETTRGQAEHLLGNLSSVIYTPPFDDASSPYRIYHRSLWEFLRGYLGQDPSRRGALGLGGRSCTQLFENRMPWIPLTPPEVLPFFQTLLADDWVSYLESILAPSDEGHPQSSTLSHSGVEWWVLTVITVEPDLAAQNISQMFWRVHADCDDEWDLCSATCILWRKIILECCRANGWSTPGQQHFTEEKKWKLAWNLNHDARPFPFYEFDHCFKPPGRSIVDLLGEATSPLMTND